MNTKPHIGYKLLTQEMTSHGGMKWEIGRLETAKIEGTEMCTSQVLHFYSHPLLAIFANPFHADIVNPRLFEVEVEACVNADNLKCASKTQRLVKELEVPRLNYLQCQFVAISCVKLLPNSSPVWEEWAEKWLSGEDRTMESETRAYACACAYASAHARAHARAYAYACAYASAYACAYASACASACACAYASACARTPTAQIINFLETSLTNPTLRPQ